MIPAEQRGSRGRGERGRAARQRRAAAAALKPPGAAPALPPAERGAGSGAEPAPTPTPAPEPPRPGAPRGHARRPPPAPRGSALLPAAAARRAALSPGAPRHHVPPQDLLRVLQLAGLRLPGDQPRGGGRVSPVPPLLERQPQPPRPLRSVPGSRIHLHHRRWLRRLRGQRRCSPRSSPPPGQPGLAGREHPPPDRPRGECSATPRPCLAAPRWLRGSARLVPGCRSIPCPRPGPRWVVGPVKDEGFLGEEGNEARPGSLLMRGGGS